MQRLTDVVLSHRLVVVMIWIAVAVVGGLNAGRTVDALSYDFGLPGQPAYETNLKIQRLYGGGGLADPLVLTAAAGSDGAMASPAAVEKFSQVASSVAETVPGTRVVTPANADRAALIAADGSRAVALLYPPVVPGPEPYAAATPTLAGAVADARVDGQPVQLTSTLLLQESAGSSRGIAFEIALGAGGAVVVLALVFASILAALPLIVAAVSILATFLALLGLTSLTEVSFVVQYLVALIGLGVAIDYSLIIVTRWREERFGGADNDTAVRIAMARAGRAVVFSGITVAVSLTALIAIPLPFLRSIGLGGLLIPLLSVATSLTLVPAILHAVGPALEWPRRRRPRDPTSARWGRFAARVVRRRWIVIAASTVLLLFMAAPALWLRLGSAETAAYGTDTDAGKVAESLSAAGLPSGLLRPVEVVAGAGEAKRLTGTLGGIPGVAVATTARDPAWTVDGQTLLQVYTRDDPASDPALRLSNGSVTPLRQAEPTPAEHRPRTPTSSLRSTSTRPWCWASSSSSAFCCWLGRCVRSGFRSRRWC